MQNIKQARKRGGRSQVKLKGRKKRETEEKRTGDREEISKNVFFYSLCVCVCVCVCKYTPHEYIHHTQRHSEVFFFSPTSGFRVALCLCYRTVPVQRSSSHHISLLTTSQKNTTRPVRKLGEKETHGRKHSVNARKGR